MRDEEVEGGYTIRRNEFGCRSIARSRAANCFIKPYESVNQRSISTYSVEISPAHGLTLFVNRKEREERDDHTLDNDAFSQIIELDEKKKVQLIADTIITGYVPNEHNLSEINQIVAGLEKNNETYEVLVEQKFYDMVNPFQIFDIEINGSELLLAGNFNFHKGVIHCGECTFNISVEEIENQYSIASDFTDDCEIHQQAESGDDATQQNSDPESSIELNHWNTKRNILSALKQRHDTFAKEMISSSSAQCLSKGNEDGDYEYAAAQQWSSVRGRWEALPVYKKYQIDTRDFSTNEFILKPSAVSADLNYQYVSRFEQTMNMMVSSFNEEQCGSENPININRLKLLEAIRPHIPELYKELNVKKIGMRTYTSRRECEKILKKILDKINRQAPNVAVKGLFFLLFPNNGKGDSYLSTEFQKDNEISEESKSKMELVEYFISILSEKILQPLIHDVFKERFGELGEEMHRKIFMMSRVNEDALK